MPVSVGRPEKGTLLLLTVFFTNLLSLACQVIWVRKVSLLFGSTATVLAIVLAVFLLGLALGALIAASIADRTERPWRALALLELLLGMYCAASLYLFELGRLTYLLVFPSDLAPLASALSKALVVLATIITPTLAIGAIFPLAVQLYSRQTARLGADVSLIYALDTLGAASGALLAAFVFVPLLGLSASTAVLGGAAVLLGLLLLARGRRPVERTMTGAHRRGVRREDHASTNAHAPAAPRVVLGVFFLTGAAALLLETGWNRFFQLLNGTNLYSLGAVLAGFLTGIGMGSLAMRWWINRIGNPWVVVAYLYAAIALGGVLVFRSADVFARVYFAVFEWSQHYYVFQLAVSLVIFLAVSLATLPMGATFPLVVKITSRDGARAGVATGRVFFANTIGAMLGALLGELVVLPRGGLSLLAVIALAVYTLAAGVFLARSGSPRRTWHAAACAVLLAAALGGAPLVTPLTLPCHALYYHGLRDGTWAAYRQALRQIQVLGQEDGFYGQVAVAQLDGDRALRINGKTDASTRRTDYVTQLMLGHVPLLLHPEPRDVLVIGLGAGGTLRAVVHHPDVQRITMVELDPLVIAMTRRFFADYNDRALDDARVHLVTNDGRNFVEGASGRWDVIVSEPSNIWVAGVSGLFTQEFYRAVRLRLNPGGILSQWLPLYEMDETDLSLILATIGSVFPHVAFWPVATDLVLVASDEPVVADETRIRTRLASAGVAADLAAIELEGDRVAAALASPRRPSAMRPHRLNVDDRPLLEFRTAQHLFRSLKADQLDGGP